MLKGCLAIRRCLSVVAVVPWLVMAPAMAQWAPAAEPTAWRLIRQNLEASGRLQPSGWIYIDAMTKPKVEAGEYLRDLQRYDNTVRFQAALLLRRDGEEAWRVRLITMRALCDQGVLERRDDSDAWAPYPGRAGTAGRVRWICSQA